VRLGVIEVDLQVGQLREGERTALLQDQPLQILQMLIERSGELVTREEIKKKFWPNDTVVEFDHSINAAIRKLRRALDDSADEPRYIGTIPRRGYRLLVPVERMAVAEDSPGEAGPQAAGGVDGAMPVRPDSGALTGRTVSHYRVLDIIGGGGMGVVYRAEDLKLGRRVALKFLPEELGSDPQALERFSREARTASSLDHPNICPIFEFGEHDGRPFLVMQLLEGETLRDRLAASEGPLPLGELLDLGIQVSDGLRAAHERGIIHRDIKPANIFLTNKGVCKILDFGVAKLLEEAPGLSPANLDEERVEAPAFGPTNRDNEEMGFQPRSELHLTRTGSAMGTAGYMSPEQVRGEKLDARADLFSFGLVLYEMATGQRAFSGETAAVVHDAIVKQPAVPLSELNSELPAELEALINKALEKDRERRYQSAAQMRADLEQVRSGKQAPALKPWIWAVAAGLLAILAVTGWLYWRSRNTLKLTDKDAVVLADFDNQTGETIFDDTLKRGLSIQLEQSPFLDLVSERKVNDTLKLMGRSPGDRLTPELSREVCQRTRSKAMLTSSISGLGRQYVIGLKAVNCDTGNVLAQAQEQAAGKEAVLKALDAAAVSLRTRLGESLSSVQQYATPLEEATTPSLDALRAYSMGLKTRMTKGSHAAIPFYQRAVEIDPNFAIAYNQLAIASQNVNDFQREEEYTRKAYQLRDRASERERFAIQANYYRRVTGEMDKAAQTYELWQSRYPGDPRPVSGLGNVYSNLGNMEKYLEQARATMRLEPNSYPVYEILANAYENLNRLDEAEEVLKQAEQQHLTVPASLMDRYELAFLKGDRAEMAELAAALKKVPGLEDALFAMLGDTEAWYGRFKTAQGLGHQAVEFAERNNDKETAAFYLAMQALSRVPAGNRPEARADAAAALKLSQSRDVKATSALALALAGDVAAAKTLAAELDQAFPLNAAVQQNWLPTIEAAIALQAKQGQLAVHALEKARAVELGTVEPVAYLCPAYVRGEAYLMVGDGQAAAREFHKFIEHYGTVGSFTWGALARLGLARAYALEAQTDPSARDKARTAYQNFLTLWKDADPDIPIYKQAKAEYAKLQ
jgi:serine/threonine protein kinase/DNA-binding winged helix-turn-helix (wHTH) protein